MLTLFKRYISGHICKNTIHRSAKDSNILNDRTECFEDNYESKDISFLFTMPKTIERRRNKMQPYT